MNYKISYSDNFSTEIQKLTDEYQIIVFSKIEILRTNPRHPSLRTKKLGGHRGLFESRVSDDIRLVWRYENNKIILMLDVGHHDMLKKY